MDKLLIKNPLLTATMNDRGEEFSGGHILIEGNRITSAGQNDIDVQDAQVIDASGMVVLPGFVNTHHHFFQSLTRNLPLMQEFPLFDWLTHHYQVWRELTNDGVYIAARTVILELMKSGTTTSSDHHYLFPEKTDGKLIDAEIKSARDLGFRFQPTRGSMSLGKSSKGLPPDDIVQNEDQIRKDTERLLAKYHDDASGAMVRLSLAPCSPFSVTKEQMRQTAEFARDNNLQIHTHLAETLDEEQFCHDLYKMRPFAFLDSLGWISSNAWFAHAIHFTDEEVAALGKAQVGVSHCPSSNMRLGSGIARIKELRNAGVNVSLAVDGSASNDSSNMLSEIRTAMMLSRLRDKEYWLSARDVLYMATRGGASALGRDDIGAIEPGKCADIALFSVKGLEYAGSLTDPLAALVFTVRTSPVDYLVINGEVKIKHGATGLDEQKIAREHQDYADEMLSRAEKNTGIDFRSPSS